MILLYLSLYAISSFIFPAFAGAPPGIRPPDSFHAEDWYPKDLPTIAPPWKLPGADLKKFQTIEAENSTTSSSDDSTSNIFSHLSLADDDFRIDGNTTDVTDTELLNVVMLTKESSQELQDLRHERQDAPNTIETPESVFNVSESLFSAEVFDLNKTSSEVILESNSSDILETTSSMPLSTAITSILTTLPIESTTNTLSMIKDTFEFNKISQNETVISNIISDDDDNDDNIGNEDESQNLTTLPMILKDESLTTSATTIESLTTEAEREFSITSVMTTTSISVTSSSVDNSSLSESLPTSSIKAHKNECSDLVFAIDSSGNVEEQYEKQKQLVRDIVHGLGTKKRRMALMTYAGRRRQRWNIPLHLNLSSASYLKKLSRARFLTGITETGAALENIYNELQVQKSIRTTVVLLTDGFSFDRIDLAATKLRTLPDITIYTTGNYFPIVREVLEVLSGPENVRFGGKAIHRLISELQC